MGKKANSLIFMLVATLLSLVIMLAFFILGIVILSWIAAMNPESQFLPAVMIILFVGAIAASFFVYSKIVKWADRKFSLEDKLDPIFGRKNLRKRGE